MLYPPFLLSPIILLLSLLAFLLSLGVSHLCLWLWLLSFAVLWLVTAIFGALCGCDHLASVLNAPASVFGGFACFSVALASVLCNFMAAVLCSLLVCL